MELIDGFVKDHKQIKDLLEPLKQFCVLVVGNQQATLPDSLRDLLQQIKETVLENHFKKEEEVLFPELEKLGVSVTYGPIGLLLKEHQRIRELIVNLESIQQKNQQGDQTSLDLFCQQIRELAYLIEQHSEKEETVLYKLAKEHLSLNQSEKPGEKRIR